MTGEDLIVAAPWLAFAAGLVVIGWRLAAGRRRRRHGPPQQCACTRPGQDGADDQPPPDRCRSLPSG